MSKRVLTIVLAVLMAATIWSVAARADVDGSFNFVIDMRPQTTSGESSKMDFDVEAYLTLNATLSGLTIGTETVMGIAGPEYMILNLSTTLGALDLKDQFVFGVPYYGVTSWYWDDWYFFAFMTPGRGMKEGVRRGDMMFIKKRVYLELTLGGLSFNNLFLLEDVSFPNPTGPDPGVDYTTDDQTWAVGDIINISGTTVSGIAVGSWTALCADFAVTAVYPKHELLKIFEWEYNLIKKKRWTDGTVETDCYDPDQTKPLLAFSKEVISVQGIPLPAGIMVDFVGVFSTVDYHLMGYPFFCPAYGTWCYVEDPTIATIPFFGDWVVQIPVFPGVDALIELYSSSLLSVSFDTAVLSLVLGDFGAVHWYDVDGDLSLTAADDVTIVGSMGFQDAVSMDLFLWTKPTLGFQVLQILTSVPISWPNPYGFLDLLATWTGFEQETGEIEFAYWSIDLGWETEHNSFDLKARYDVDDGLHDVSVNIGVFWSI
jgi:hypothetical protein